jgi:hypothetical protein
VALESEAPAVSRGHWRTQLLCGALRQVTLVTSATAAAEAARARGEDLAAAPLPPDSVAAAGVPFSKAELQVRSCASYAWPVRPTT